MTRKLVRFWPFAIAKKPLSPRIAAATKRRKAVVALVSGMIVYLILHIALAATCEFSRYLRDPLYADKEIKLSRLERSLPTGSQMVLFLGTSRIGNGIDAGQAQAKLTEGLGRPVGAFNWGTPGAGPACNLVHLRRILSDGHRPSHLLLEIFPPGLATIPGEAVTYEDRFLEGMNLEWSELDSIGEYGLPAERLREQRQSVLISPWYSLRFRIMGRLRPTMLPYHLRYDWSRGPDINGWSPIVAENVSDEQREAGVKRTKEEFGYILEHATLNEGAVRAFREMLSIARKERIQVAVIRMPDGTNLRKLHPQSMNARFDRLLNELVAEYGCRVYDTREWMSDDAFMDGTHLLRRGAEAYTRRLVQEAIEPFVSSATDGLR
ncbi:MAG TPA: hypothetical protein VG097_12435 [Gemmata sp.]|nr:hypothetical protein [Gemmata sp.]